MSCTCPTCGQPMNVGRAPIEGLASAPLSKQERLIVEVLTETYPRVVKADFLLERLYADDPEGGPECAVEVLRQLLWRIRKKLPTYGWTVQRSRGGAGNYGSYKLEPLP
jgi:DNA-binding response OmpR family regulator